MKRRSFLRNISLAGLGPLLLNGIPVNALGRSGALQNLAAASTNDKVLVLIQLHGGNDGLNTLIPINQYNKYLNLRPNIAIPENGSRKFITLDSTLSDSQQLGIHPDMEAFKALYNDGMASVIQNVGYDNINGSHFRSSDVWFMGGGYDDYLSSGWMGRYLDHTYPGYPAAYPSADMQDPLGLEIGNSVSLGFHTGKGIPTAISAESPEEFYDLISKVGITPPTNIANTYYGKELQWLADVEQKSNQYAGRLKEIYARGRNSKSGYATEYPHYANGGSRGNSLASQLQIISRLLSGGCKTKVFLARITGFDTHADQAEASDPTMGTHASLLFHLFSAIKGFQDELKDLGLADKVLTTTFSEFGRRASSNGSQGTDHGTAAPMFVFGKHVNPGIIGANTDLNNLTDDNLEVKQDYRGVFGTILKDWMGADSAALDKTMFTEFTREPLPIIRKSQAGTPIAPVAPTADTTTQQPTENVVSERFYILNYFPNPASTHLDIVYQLEETTPLEIMLLDMNGRPVVEERWDARGRGKHKTRLTLPNLPNGIYLLHWKAGETKVTHQVVVEQ